MAGAALCKFQSIIVLGEGFCKLENQTLQKGTALRDLVTSDLSSDLLSEDFVATAALSEPRRPDLSITSDAEHQE